MSVQIELPVAPITFSVQIWFPRVSYFFRNELLPIKKRCVYQKWLKKENKKLIRYDNIYKKNLIRSNSESPMAFSVVGFK